MCGAAAAAAQHCMLGAPFLWRTLSGVASRLQKRSMLLRLALSIYAAWRLVSYLDPICVSESSLESFC